MNINQVFKILQKYGGLRAARIITDSRKGRKTPFLWVLWAKYQLKNNVPVAKIIHEKWFYGLKFYTNKYTLDPRPDSETLVEAVIKNSADNIKMLDMGTGTGCLIISLVKNIPNSTGVAIDKSGTALRVAKRNIKNFGLNDRIILKHAKFDSKISEKFDVIVSNPPYIAFNDSRVDNGAKHDPKMALYAKNNGLFAYEQISKSAKKLLKENGKIYLEIGEGQGPDVRKIFESENWKFVNSFNDLSGIERVICFSF